MAEFIDCPQIVDEERCNNLAEVTVHWIMESTDGPIEHIGSICVRGHVLFFPTFMMERADGNV